MSLSRRQFVKVFGLSAAALGSMGVLAGCSGEDAGNGSTSSESKVEAIKARGKLNCGVKQDVVGYGYLNTTRGPLIDNDTLDVVVATYTITPEREEDWDFSEPYRTDSVGIMVMKNSGIESMVDLDGKIIGVSQGSTTKDAILQMLEDEGIDATPTFNEYPDYPSINSALESGNIDAFAMDRSTLNTYMNDQKEYVEPDIKFGTQEYGVATKKGSDLSDVVDETVTELLGNGWMDEEITTWLGESA